MEYSKFVRLWDIIVFSDMDEYSPSIIYGFFNKYRWGILFILYNFLFFLYLEPIVNNGTGNIFLTYLMIFGAFGVFLWGILSLFSIFISYPIRIRRAKKLVEQKQCVTREQAGTILDCYVLKEDIHFWNGCKCKCGKTKRDKEHNWNGCKCAVCGITRDEEHNWNGCKCTVCGITRDEEHNWNGCKCAVCGRTRDEKHDYSNKCVCKRCGKTSHNFVVYKEEPSSISANYNNYWSKCTKCGKLTTGSEWVTWENRD
jgi:hypothetical protein